MRNTVHRVTWMTALLASALLLMVAQLYRFTIAQSTTWRTLAEGNILREFPTYGPRGRIFDQKGRPLATSKKAHAAVITNKDAESVAAVLPELALILADGDQAQADKIITDINKRLDQGNQELFMVLERNLSQNAVATLAERRSEFPEVMVVEEPIRIYPQGKIGGTFLGYAKGIIAEQLEQPEFKEYRGDQVVGHDGLELSYEKDLQGKPGKRLMVVDPVGRPVESLADVAPVPGNDLHLSIDLDLQRVAEEALAKQMAWVRANDRTTDPYQGAVVVQDVRTGAILAIASYPSVDPNIMAHGLTEKIWDELQGDTKGRPLENKALQQLSPGSTFKMATGLAAMELGAVGPYEQIPCPARYWHDPYPRNWLPYDQGPTDVARALSTSCNPYFYEVGRRMGLDPFSQFLEQFGFGKKLGIDLPYEAAGSNPTSEDYGSDWGPGQVYNVAIGQGLVEVTPLQLANYTATIAANGTRYKPYLVSKIVDPSGEVVMERKPEKVGQVNASSQSLKRIQQGMRQAVTSSEGTAYAPFLGFPIEVAAKTGSAETGLNTPPDATTVAYAPYDKPEIAVSVVIRGGSTGSWATPVARRIMAQYFGINDVIPSYVPTYRD